MVYTNITKKNALLVVEIHAFFISLSIIVSWTSSYIVNTNFNSKYIYFAIDFKHTYSNLYRGFIFTGSLPTDSSLSFDVHEYWLY